MKKTLFLSIVMAFSVTNMLKADLFYDLYNTTNKNIRITLMPSNNDPKRQAAINLAPKEIKPNHQYYNYTGPTSGASQPKSWGVKQIIVQDLDSGTTIKRDIKKDLQKEFLKITVSFSENIGTKGSEKPMGLWFDYTKKK